MQVDPTIDPETNKKLCYYKILGIDQQESDEKIIKKAYLKAAFKYHPDKNRDNQEYADAMFKHLQDAYACIQDPQERAYYDRNKNSVLLSSPEEADEFYNVETFVNINFMRSASCYNNFRDDDEKGFYRVYDGCFKQLFEEEVRASAQRVASDEKISMEMRNKLDTRVKSQFINFGNSTTSRTDINSFYTFWQNFITLKPFTHKDVYDGSKENSRIRKIVRGENEKAREDARREFQEKIRNLSAFVKRRDPRILEFENQDRVRETQKKLELQRKQEEKEREQRDAMVDVVRIRQHRVSQLSDKMRKNMITPAEMLELEQIALTQNLESDKIADQFEQEKKSIVAEKKEDFNIRDYLTADQIDFIKLGLIMNGLGKYSCSFCQQKFSLPNEFKPHLQSKKHKSSLVLKQNDSTPDDLKSSVKVKQNSKKVIAEEVFITDISESLPTESKQTKEKTTDFQCHICRKYFETRNKLFQHIKETGHAKAIDSAGKKQK